MSKSVFIFGATGSIGQQTIDIIRNDVNFKLIGISFYKNYHLANKIKKEFNLDYVFSHSSNKEWENLILKINPDIIVNSIAGLDGIYITKFCIDNNKFLCLANKESIVAAGSFINFNNSNIVPIDSEHSALYELIKTRSQNIKTIYITASGGPFYNLNNEEKYFKTFNETIKHPIWNMGYKISIDSATLVNKCFEIIEAYYLFNISNIKPLYHPTSIVHALVEYQDNSIFSYMSYPDMKLPIQLSLYNYSNLNSNSIIPLDFSNLTLHFENIDFNKHLPIKWAMELINNKLYAIGIIINVVNDYLVELFKNNKIYFGQIILIIDQYITKYKNYKINNFDSIFALKDKILKELIETFNLKVKYE